MYVKGLRTPPRGIWGQARSSRRESKGNKHHSRTSPLQSGYGGPGEVTSVRVKENPENQDSPSECSPRQSPPTLRETPPATNSRPQGSEHHEPRARLDTARKQVHLPGQDIHEREKKGLHSAPPPTPPRCDRVQPEPLTSY